MSSIYMTDLYQNSLKSDEYLEERKISDLVFYYNNVRLIFESNDVLIRLWKIDPICLEVADMIFFYRDLIKINSSCVNPKFSIFSSRSSGSFISRESYKECPVCYRSMKIKLRKDVNAEAHKCKDIYLFLVGIKLFVMNLRGAFSSINERDIKRCLESMVSKDTRIFAERRVLKEYKFISHIKETLIVDPDDIIDMMIPVYESLDHYIPDSSESSFLTHYVSLPDFLDFKKKGYSIYEWFQINRSFTKYVFMVNLSSYSFKVDNYVDFLYTSFLKTLIKCGNNVELIKNEEMTMAELCGDDYPLSILILISEYLMKHGSYVDLKSLGHLYGVIVSYFMRV